MEQMAYLSECLNFFYLLSGQKVNVEKTKILFSKNVEGPLAQRISTKSGFSKTFNLGKYLSVPLLHNRVSVSTYSYILKKIQGRLAGWKVDRLSIAGTVTLCKLVLSALPIYTIQLASLPKMICNEIEKIYRKFVWG